MYIRLCEHCSKSDCERWHTGSVVRLVVSRQSTHSTFSFLSLAVGFIALITIPHQQPLQSKTHTNKHVLQRKHIHCISMQILADTNTRTFRLAAGGVQRLSQLLYAVSLLPPPVNTAAPWFGSQEPDTHLLNRLARVFPVPASNSLSLPTLH